MALITCPECGHQISDKARRCPKCGCPMSATHPSAASTEQQRKTAVTTTQSNAGKTNSVPQKNIVQTPKVNVPSTSTDTGNKPNRMSTTLWIGIIAAIVVIGGLLAVLLINKGPKKNDVNTDITTQDTVVEEAFSPEQYESTLSRYKQSLPSKIQVLGSCIDEDVQKVYCYDTKSAEYYVYNLASKAKHTLATGGRIKCDGEYYELYYMEDALIEKHKIVGHRLFFTVGLTGEEDIEEGLFYIDFDSDEIHLVHKGVEVKFGNSTATITEQFLIREGDCRADNEYSYTTITFSLEDLTFE